MAKSNCNVRKFVHRVFSPCIAVFSSSTVEDICQKNNLSFIELLEPFVELDKEVTYRDPSNTIISVTDLQINLCDIHSKPPEAAVARRLLNESVSSVTPENIEHITLKSGNFSLDVPSSVPWFEKWRETFLRVQFPSDHEFTKHYIACMVVISSNEDNPMDTLSNMVQQLQQMLSTSPPKMMPKWFSSSILRFYVLVHDNSVGDIKKARKVYEEMKSTYNATCCYLLQINSRKSEISDVEISKYWQKFHKEKEIFEDLVDDVKSKQNLTMNNNQIEIETDAEIAQTAKTDHILHPLSPELDSQRIFNDGYALKEDDESSNGVKNLKFLALFLSQEDIDQIKTLLSNFILNALIPFIETQMQYLNEMVSNKKGVSKSLFSATKRWFGGPKPGTPTNVANSHYYHPDSPELQMRRLGDLCFMFSAYSFAFQAYHSAKRDFNADGAWLYYAGALEMAALSAFLAGQDIKKAQEYVEESVNIYLHTCRMPQFATRLTLCATEYLKSVNMFGEAAGRLLQMTSEDSDLRSALLLEEASYCFINARKPCMPRKYAFHLVLAGHRFAKAGQKKHSLRCYTQAYQIYENKNWSLAEDHIHFTIGKLASSLKQKEETVKELSKLFVRPSTQSPTQQANFLKEYFQSLIELIKERNDNDLSFLEVPRIDQSSITVMLNVFKSDHSIDNITLAGSEMQEEELNNSRWWKLEENLVAHTNNNLVPVSFKPTINIFSNSTNTTVKPTCVVGERIRTSVDLVNILNIPLHLKNIKLIWKYNSSDDNTVLNTENCSSVAETETINSVLLEPDSSKKISLYMTILAAGHFCISGIMYTVLLQQSVESVDSLSITGYTKLQPPPPIKNSIITSQLSRMSLNNTELTDYRLHVHAINEAPRLKVYFENIPHEMYCGEIHELVITLQNIGTLPIDKVTFTSSNPDSISGPIYNAKVDVFTLVDNDTIHPEQSRKIIIYIRAPDKCGPVSIDFLFLYDNIKFSQSKLKHRLIYHTLHLIIHNTLQSITFAKRSIILDTEKDETMNIRLKVHNTNIVRNDNEEESLLLHQISLLSSNWRLHHLICPNDEIPTKLDSDQTAFITIKAIRKSKHTAEYSDLVLNSTNTIIPSMNKPYCNFTHSFTSKFLTEKNQKLPSNCKENNFRQVIADVESAFKINSTLILFWKMKCKRANRITLITGQQHLPLMKFEKTYTSGQLEIINGAKDQTSVTSNFSASLTSNIFFNNPITKEMLLVQINHPSFVKHSFTTNRMCQIAVDFIIRNCCDCFLEVKLDASNHTNSAKFNDSSVFLWLGIVLKTFILEPHSFVKQSLYFCTGNTGTYDLSSQVILSARKFKTDNVFIVQSSIPHAFLHISNNV